MTTEIENFDIGDKVKHSKFGTGTIVFRTGEGDKQKVTVKFGGEIGEKKLLARLANLKLISERPTVAPEEAVEAVPGRAKLGKKDDDDDDAKEVDSDDEDDDADDDSEEDSDDDDSDDDNDDDEDDD